MLTLNGANGSPFALTAACSFALFPPFVCVVHSSWVRIAVEVFVPPYVRSRTLHTILSAWVITRDREGIHTRIEKRSNRKKHARTLDHALKCHVRSSMNELCLFDHMPVKNNPNWKMYINVISFQVN